MSLLIERCSFRRGETGSVLADGGRIVCVSSDETQRVPEATRRIDAGGATLLAGIGDSHCHPFEFGWLKRSLDLRGTTNITGLRLRVAAALKNSAPGEWVVGRGWDHEAFAEGRMPHRGDVDDLSPENPVLLSRVCGHVGLLNTRAIEALGLSGQTGPEYERDPNGALTGIVKEEALSRAYAGVPGRSTASCVSDLLSAEVEAARQGITAMHTILSEEDYKEELDALLSLQLGGRLTVRHRVYVPPNALDYVEERELRGKFDGAAVRLNGVKLYCDGSLGARTAALREPYSDDPSNRGALRYRDEELAGLVQRAVSAEYQVIIHAIGDRAIDQAIDALEAVTGGGNPMRHRIEHASLLPKDLRARLRRHSIRLSVQPSFITSDTWAQKRLGDDRVDDLYPLRSIVGDGTVASAGSDAPVESFSPMVGTWAAMARGGFARHERIDLGDALQMYTSNSASNGLDSDAGEVREGLRADLTLLDSRIEGMHYAMVRKVGIAATVVGGRVVHSNVGTAG